MSLQPTFTVKSFSGAYDRYDMKDAHEGIDKTVEGGGAAGYDEAALAMPEEYPELERPPLRKIDKYCMPEVPCVPISKRFTQVRRLNIR